MNNSTLALDTATLCAALATLSFESERSFVWQPKNDEQQRLLNLLDGKWAPYHFFKGPQPQVAQSHEELNAFQQEHGLMPSFKELGPKGIGIATVLRLTPPWWAGAIRSRLNNEGTIYRSFDVPAIGVRVVARKGYDNPVIHIPATDGTTLWLNVMQRPSDELALSEAAAKLIEADEISRPRHAIVRLPALTIDMPADLSWLHGLSLNDRSINQASQHLTIQLNEEAAYSADIRGIATHGEIEPQIELNQPFLGFFTGSAKIPFGTFYADRDSWQVSLEAP